MNACRIYPFARENAKLFAQELIEYVLKDFGHIWSPQRTDREKRLRAVATYVFIPEIGKLVTYFSRKHGGFVVMTCYNAWKYIKTHRDCVLEHMISNAIASLCNRCELEDDDLGLFVFMAIVVEYARFVIIDEKKHLVEGIVSALSYCLTDIIPGGFIETLFRLHYRASTFEVPEQYIVSDHLSDNSFTSPISTDSLNTPRSEFESPLNFSLELPADTQYDTPMEEIEVEFKKRELHREFFKRELKSDISVETGVEDNAHYLSYSDRVRSNSEGLEVDANANAGDKKYESSDECSVEKMEVELKEPCVQTEIQKDSSSSNTHQENEVEVPEGGSQGDSKSGKLEAESSEIALSKILEAIDVVEVTESLSETLIIDEKIEKASEELKDIQLDNSCILKAPEVEQFDTELKFVNVEEKCDNTSSKEHFSEKTMKESTDEQLKTIKEHSKEEAGVMDTSH